MRSLGRRHWMAVLSTVVAVATGAAEIPEYRVKAAFLYNFAQFVDWPATVGPEIVLCTYGEDLFGSDLDSVKGQPVGERTIQVQRHVPAHGVDRCQILFVGRNVVDELPMLRERLAGKPVLLVTDRAGAIDKGAALNMSVVQGRVTFEASRRAARESGIDLSSRLLRLATRVIQ